MYGDTGRVLYERDGHARRLIASTTKLMTALTALESGHSLGEIVTVKPEWAGVEGSSIYLVPGEKLTLEALLYGLLLRSGNDAALAIAGHCGGTVAEALGMADSHFANPNGLDAEGHYSSAYDMALLARTCLEHEELAKIVSTRSITLGTRTFTNHNKLLWRYEGCVGMKTGYTEKAGRTLVSAARRDGMTLICVTLNAPSDWADHTALFDWGFANYEARTLARTGEKAGRLPVSGGLTPLCSVELVEDLTAALSPGERVEAVCELWEAALTAPVSAGTQVGADISAAEHFAECGIDSVPDILAPRGGFNLWRNVFKS